MTILTIRQTTSEDDLAVADIERFATAELRKVYRPTAAASAKRSTLAPDLTGLVALLDGRAVGAVRYRVAEGRLSLLGLGVHPDFRRRGIAAALGQHLEAIGADSDCAFVSLYTVRETGNVAIFERMGFAVESEGPTDLFESPLGLALTEVFMTKAIVSPQCAAPRAPSGADV